MATAMYRRQLSAFDRGVMSAISPQRSRTLDHLLPGLGRAANHSKLWLALAGAMAAAPRRTTRRAALRGLASVGIASGTANLVGKRLVPRTRPGLLGVPLIRQLSRVPSSSSFPSGHAASAAAFATGVALENPYIALPVAALAVGVAASRVVTGVHYPSDVVAGAAIGVATGLVTTRWWPTLDPDPALAAPVSHPVPALPTGEGLILVINAAAGTARAELAQRIERELPDARIVLVDEGSQLPEALEKAAREAVVLGAAGGDGTINTAAGIARAAGLPLLVVPAGTLNHFAMDLGLETVDDAVDALRRGNAVAVDVGTVAASDADADADRIFINTFSIGAYVDLVEARERFERLVGKWPAVLAGAVSVLREGRPVECLIDGVERRVWLLFAGNCVYQPSGLAPSQRRKLDDGNLDIRIVDAARPLARFRLLAALAAGTLATCRVYEYRNATTLSLKGADGPLGFAIDGEAAGAEADLDVGKAPRSLVVYRPAPPSEG